jgi:hypothetical protein
MTDVKIFKPAKSAMQSGRANTQKWIIYYEWEDCQYVEPIMQWTASTSTKSQVKLEFESKQEAIDFAHKNDWSFTIEEPHLSQIKPKSYTDNFIRPS